jgi:CheY-like chemotaxis protein
MPKILIVEDNDMNRDMLSRRLIRNGFEIVIAVDGAQGVALATKERPDLILMGLSLCSWILRMRSFVIPI